MKIRRILMPLLAVMLCMAIIPAVHAAGTAPEAETQPMVEIIASGSCGSNATWALSDSGVLYIQGTGAMTNFSTVSSVPWASYRSQIQTVYIEGGITTVGDYALQSCTAMTYVGIPESVKTIGREALLGCTSLYEVRLPNVTSIKTRAFADCTGLHTIRFFGTAPTFESSVDFRGVSATAYYPPVGSWTSDKLKNYGGNLTWVCNDQCGDEITWSVSSDGELEIYGYGEIWDCNGEYAPWYYLQDVWDTVYFGGEITEIGDEAFWGCSSMKSISLPYTLTRIGEYAFRFCDGLESIKIPALVTSIEQYAFDGCWTLDIYFNGNAPTFGYYVFNDDSVTIHYPPLPSWEAAKSQINDEAYDPEEDVTYFDVTWALDNKCGDNATWSISSSGVLTISGSGAIWDYYDYYPAWYYAPDAWNTLKINSGITGIGEYAFYKCDSLKSVTIPNTVKTIGYMAFDDCDALTSVAIPNSVTAIGSYAFSGCDKLASLTMGTGVKTIGDSAFYDCVSLTSVAIGSGVTSIEDQAFYGCSSLKTVTIPVSVKDIWYEAFAYCDALTDVNYGGIPADWAKINIRSGNECLTGATIHYTYKPLTAPQNVKAVADTATTMKVSWSAVPGATKYVVYRKEGSADWKAFTNTTATSITLKTNLKHGYNYRFRIYAKNPQYTSAGSEIVLLKFIPPTPTGLTISSTGVGQATIKWDAIPNIKGYCVYYKRADDSGYTYAGATTATSKTITGLTTGARYAFKIRAYVPATAGIYQGQNIFSEYCKYVSGEIVPAAPTGLKIASTAAGKATITWNKVSGAYAYCIYYKRADDAGYTYFGATTATSKTITGLTTGKRYAFKIRAYCKPTTGPKAGQNVFGPYCKYVSGEIKAN